ncbi:mRNA export factor mex67 [Aspergillus avenaceus]|uniref:mRNA export factor MEX67 n=1 Tax=Aspergillus avenaceus TaxID=36643 RepID=A0A5N6TMX2_ASPAV|nr:mRNA export factor mex67 [Aspergillus avenaceus]
MKGGKAPRNRPGTSDRGGIRKKAAAKRVDRDGDLAMDAGSAQGRGKKARGNTGRPVATTSRAPTRGRALDAIQKAITSNSDTQANIRQSRGGGLEQVSVQGWKQSKAASNRDGGLESLITFLEKKLNSSDTKASSRARITKSRVEGDALIVSIRPEHVERMLQINGFSFAGAPLTIQNYDPSMKGMLDQPMLSELSQNGSTPSAAETKSKMTAILGKRYHPQQKLLDLSKLGSDPDLLSMGIFNSTSTESKFFPALMKVWEINFNTSAERQGAVESVSLADNQLANISVVTTLAQAFPGLKNLDLSNNNFKDAQSMIGWRWKFRQLEFLDLIGNPFSADPTFKDTMLKWYPKLRYLNNTEVRTAEEVAAQKKTPIPVQAPHFQDESQIGENFIKAFFAGYDNNRNDLVSGVYDNNSTFSLNVNTSAPRAQQTEPAGWDSYIKKSRNLFRISHLPARMSRSFVGVEKIRELWNTLPETRHPDIASRPEEWLIECFPTPGLPDPTGQSPTGVGGLIIMVHGKFDEISAGKVESRSFDRTFILGPGGGMGGIRVINDILCLRAYGGHEAWKPEEPAVPAPQPVQPPVAAPVAPPALPEGYGMPAPGKPDAQLQQELLVMQISAKTNMTLQYSEMALSGNGWSLEAALKNFEELKQANGMSTTTTTGHLPSNGAATLDPLDAADYDPIDHLNAIFSHPSTLSSVSQVSQSLLDYEDELDDEIGALVEEQVTSNAESVERIQAAQADLTELFKKIDDVRDRASRTELEITEMTADIKQLDNAKKNLTQSMTALKRLQMLTTAYDQLRVLAKTRQYRDCAQLLQAVIQLMAHFKSYRSIDQIALLSRNVADIQRELLEQVCEDFELAFAKGEVGLNRVMLSEGCLVMDALGGHAKSRLITWYCNFQLREYRQVFRNNEEAGSLDNISRRYSWFRRILKIYDEEYGPIFAAHWKVDEILANVFCEGTREDFKGILSRSVRNGQTIDVNLLLSCLQETLDFEHTLERRFVNPSRPSTDTFASSEAPVFGQAISEAFEPYLSVWVEAQDKQLATLIPKYRQQPIRPPDEEFDSNIVISSSTELFTFYRHALQQCAKLSTGGSLADLGRVFSKYLDQYAQQVLLYYISERPTGTTPSKVPSLEDLILVLNTADYCYTTCTQLEEKIKGRLDKSLKQSVDLQSQADSFMGIASAAVRCLVRMVEVDIEPCWREMRNTPWNRLEAVSDQSTYVSELMTKINAKSAEILQLLHKQQYVRAFADHVVELISNVFITNVFQCKPVSETGAEQMLLDAYTLKTGLSSLMPSPTPAGFAKRVNNSFTKIETLLKTLQVQPSPPEALVQAYLIHIKDSSNTNFRKILDLKGIRSRQEQNQLLELFQIHRASDRHAPNLQQSNPILTALQSSASSSSSNPGLGLGTAAASIGASNLPTRFDASMLGSALISAAKDGVDRFGTPAATNPSTGGPGSTTPVSPGPFAQLQSTPGESSAAVNLNENLKNIGKFFRRDLGGFGGRFGRSGDD